MKSIKYILGFTLIFNFVFTTPLPVEAIGSFSSVFNSSTDIQGIAGPITAGGPEVPVNDAIQRYQQVLQTEKEFGLDTVAFTLANQALNTMASDVIDWINSGFDGNPAFISDLDGYLDNIGDQVFSDFIEGTSLEFLCSPFELPIKLAISSRYGNSFRNRVDCTIDDVVANIEDFTENFGEGGWDAWYELTQNPQNNIFGVYLETEIELSKRIAERQGEERQKLNWGEGFLSKEVCEGEGEDRDCKIVTPGSVIEEQLNNTISSGQDRLEVADELNEIVSALANQLISQTLSGAGGLLGASDSGGSGSSYTDRLRDSQTPQQDINLGDIGDVIGVNGERNLALSQRTRQSGQYGDARSELAVDGSSSSDKYARSVAITDKRDSAWWEVDLGEVKNINEIEIHRNTRNTNSESAVGKFNIFISHNPFSDIFNPEQPITWQAGTYKIGPQTMPGSGPFTTKIDNTGQYIRIQRIPKISSGFYDEEKDDDEEEVYYKVVEERLQLAEVRIYGTDLNQSEEE